MLKMIKRLKRWLGKDENVEFEEFVGNIKYKAEEIGIEKGEKRGKAEERKAIAKNLLNKKVDIETITSCTGLDKREVLSLQKRLY